MAEQHKPKKKGRVKPEGYDTWPKCRKDLYRAVSYVRRLRALARTDRQNLEDASVIAMTQPDTLSPAERTLLDELQAECYVLSRSLPSCLEMVRDVANVPDRNMTAA